MPKPRLNTPNTAKGLTYLNKVRRRAGLPVSRIPGRLSGMPTGSNSWMPSAERMSEFCLECRWFHDLRRWKTAHLVLGKTPKSWNLNGSAPEDYYQVIDVYEGRRPGLSPRRRTTGWLFRDQININPNLSESWLLIGNFE